MIETRIIDRAHKSDINLPNQPFPLFGRLLPSYSEGVWQYRVQRLDPSQVTEMCFPEEAYDYDAMSANSVFIGAYDGDTCVGLAILQDASFRYMYLYDLKVNAAYRGKKVASMLIEKAKALCQARGYSGIYTQGQDNNLGACLFYLHRGFEIGGLDTRVYKGTAQEGKHDILFYLDC